MFQDWDYVRPRDGKDMLWALSVMHIRYRLQARD